MTNTISIVGNAPSALNFRLGDQIESSDLVIRMNNFEVKNEWAPFIGSKTDIYACNLYIKEVGPKLKYIEKHKIKEVWASIPFNTRISHWKEDYMAAEVILDKSKLRKLRFKEFCQILPNIRNKALLYLCHLFGNRLYKPLIKYIQIPSTGIISIAIAIRQKPKKVIVTGFDFFSGSKSHYFSNKGIPNKTHHNFVEEPAILRNMIITQPQTSFVFGLHPELYARWYSDLPNTTNTPYFENKLKP